MNIPDFISNPVFWFALVNAIVVFLPRFGIVLTAQEIASLNIVIAAIFKVAPPVTVWTQQTLTAARLKRENEPKG